MSQITQHKVGFAKLYDICMRDYDYCHAMRKAYGLEPGTSTIDCMINQLIDKIINDFQGENKAQEMFGNINAMPAPHLGSMNLQSAAYEYVVGAMCKTYDLTQQQHNNKIVELVEYIKSKGRWRVHVSQSSEGAFMQLRQHNLHVLAPTYELFLIYYPGYRDAP